jgi:hypothetical protein
MLMEKAQIPHLLAPMALIGYKFYNNYIFMTFAVKKICKFAMHIFNLYSPDGE